MKETTLWKCEVCGTEYREKSKCEKCEASHKKKGKIVKMRQVMAVCDCRVSFLPVKKYWRVAQNR